VTTVGVVTVCRNDLAGLKATLNSARGQTLAPTRLAVVDGASTDGTPEWLATTSLPPWVDWTSEDDGGIYDAMNKGAQRTSDCDLVIFMNGGDRFANPSILSRVVSDFERNRWPWAYGDSVLVDISGTRAWTHQVKYFRKLRFMVGVGSVPHQATVYQSSFFEQVGPFRTDLPIVADQEQIFRCWVAQSPHYLGMTVATCDDGGIGNNQPPGTFALIMAEFRRESGRLIFRSERVDQVATRLARRHLILMTAVRRLLAGRVSRR
jgi:glycosyltransferase involved in cell wall biosynthesis